MLRFNFVKVTRLVEAYQNKLVMAMKASGYDSAKSTDNWSFSGAFLYSLTVITTIGKLMDQPFCILNCKPTCSMRQCGKSLEQWVSTSLMIVCINHGSQPCLLLCVPALKVSIARDMDFLIGNPQPNETLALLSTEVDLLCLG